jgi:hypothetical protein
MPTMVVKTIGTSGRDYSTVASWEAQNLDLVSLDQEQRGECYKDSTFSISSGITIAGWTTNTTHRLYLTSASGQAHTGTAGTGVKIDGGNNNILALTILNTAGFVEISYLEIRNVATNTLVRIYYNDDSVHHCLLYDATGGNGIYSHVDDGRRQKIYRNIAYNCSNGFAFRGSYNSGDLVFYSNTMTLNAKGFYNGSNDSKLCSDNISVGNTDNWYGEGGAPTLSGSNNMGDTGDTDVPGTSKKYSSASVEFVNAASDFHLKTGAVAIAAGANLGSPYDVDIDGVTVTGTWDIGADQYVAVAVSGEDRSTERGILRGVMRGMVS